MYNPNEDMCVEETKYQRLFREINITISDINEKVIGTLAFSDGLIATATQGASTPSSSPLEGDLRKVLERLVELKNKIN